VAPSEVAAAPTPPPSDSRGHVGLVFMPGVSSFPNYHGFSGTKAEGQIALEFRGSEGGARVRLTAEYTTFGKIGEISFKYDFLEGFFFRPWLAVGLGIASINPDPAVRASGSAAGGVDLYITRDFFLTGEVKGRLFTEGTQGAAHGLAISATGGSFHCSVGWASTSSEIGWLQLRAPAVLSSSAWSPTPWWEC